MSDIRKINSQDFYRLKTSKEKIKFLLKYGILAPSTHNCQPWLFKIGDDYCEIYRNVLINLPEADKTGRDMYISFGCLIENLSISANYYNVKFEINYILDKKTYLIAKIKYFNLNQTIKISKNSTALLNAILTRKTIRGKFNNKRIPNEIVNELDKLNFFKGIYLSIFTNHQDIIYLGNLTSDGMKLAYKSKLFRIEMAKWFRTNISNKKEGLPGYALGMSTILSLIFPNIVRYLNIGNIVAKMNFKCISTAPMICLITSEKNDETTWLNTGRLAQRIMLILTAKNIQNSIYVSSIEMGELYKKIQKKFKTTNIPQFLFCAGYSSINTKFTNRYVVEEKLYSKLT